MLFIKFCSSGQEFIHTYLIVCVTLLLQKLHFYIYHHLTYLSMTTAEIQQQITMIREVAEQATQSREYALSFLADAGILELIKPTTTSEKPKS